VITFKKTILSNGLRVLVHEDHSTPMAVLNVMYDVGARDENPDKTGFAHLFEHLMFGGSVNIPDFDTALEQVGGENNAFTSNDITNYYIQLPATNLETAFWLESDRMLNLAFSEKSLEVQRNVVCEEFKQRYINQPYGDVWQHLRPLIYKVHPYRWSTIGKELAHIENATMDDVRAFFKKHYNPQNAILVVSGNVSNQEVLKLAKKYFEPIPKGEKYLRSLPQEPLQVEKRELHVDSDVPQDAIYKAYTMPDKLSPDYYTCDLLSDILSNGKSSRLYSSLVRDKQIFSELNAYVMGSIDPGLLVISGKPMSHISLAEADAAIEAEIANLITNPITENELEKVLNKVESTHVFENMELLNKSINLAFAELLGDANLANQEIEKYRAVDVEQINTMAYYLFRDTNSSTLFYHKKNNN
jgi:zinc protease